MSIAVPYNPVPPRFLSGQERAAVLLLAMSPETAKKILKHFDAEMIKTLTKVASTLGQVQHNQISDLVEEFIHNLSNGSDIVGNPSEIQKLLSTILPKDQYDGIMEEVHGDANRSIWERISTVSEQLIASYLLKEHPQTAAIILSKINPKTSAKVLKQMHPELRNTVTNRMLSLKPIIEESAKGLEAALQENFVTNFSRDASADTHSRMAKILNVMDRDDMESVLRSLGESRPKSVEILKNMLFTFEDVCRLSSRDRTHLLEQVSIDVVATSLKGVNLVVKENILGSISSRTRRIIENEMENSGSLTQKDINEARRSITDLALELAGRGEIEVPVEGDGEISYS